MATYRYRAATAGGQLKTGVLEGSSRADAIERVKRLGLMPIETVETQAKAGSADAPAIRLNAATRRGIVNAIGELAVLLNAGLPLDPRAGGGGREHHPPAGEGGLRQAARPRAPRRLAGARDDREQRRLLAHGGGDGGSGRGQRQARREPVAPRRDDGARRDPAPDDHLLDGLSGDADGDRHQRDPGDAAVRGPAIRGSVLRRRRQIAFHDPDRHGGEPTG